MQTFLWALENKELRNSSPCLAMTPNLLTVSALSRHSMWYLEEEPHCLSINRLLFAANVSQKIKKLGEKLERVCQKLYAVWVCDVDTFSHDSSIIGRDANREAILVLLSRDLRLLWDYVWDHVSLVSIVYRVEETALAWLLYNDEWCLWSKCIWIQVLVVCKWA